MTDTEINEAVARKLNAWGKEWKISQCQDYCHSIAAAWEVVEYKTKLNTGFVFGLGWRGDEGWWCKMEIGHIDPEVRVYETADTAPLAICLAFLKIP